MPTSASSWIQKFCTPHGVLGDGNACGGWSGKLAPARRRGTARSRWLERSKPTPEQRVVVPDPQADVGRASPVASRSGRPRLVVAVGRRRRGSERKFVTSEPRSAEHAGADDERDRRRARGRGGASASPRSADRRPPRSPRARCRRTRRPRPRGSTPTRARDDRDDDEPPALARARSRAARSRAPRPRTRRSRGCRGTTPRAGPAACPRTRSRAPRNWSSPQPLATTLQATKTTRKRSTSTRRRRSRTSAGASSAYSTIFAAVTRCVVVWSSGVQKHETTSRARAARRRAIQSVRARRSEREPPATAPASERRERRVERRRRRPSRRRRPARRTCAPGSGGAGRAKGIAAAGTSGERSAARERESKERPLYSVPPMRSRVLWRRSATALGAYVATALGFLTTVVATRELGRRRLRAVRRRLRRDELLPAALDLTVEEALVKYGFRYTETRATGAGCGGCSGSRSRFKLLGGAARRRSRWSCSRRSRATLWGADDVRRADADRRADPARPGARGRRRRRR